MKKTTQVTVRRKLDNSTQSPVVSIPHVPTVTTVRRPAMKPGATVSPSRPRVESGNVVVRRGLGVKTKK